jgi:2',3'-cyclic-nucleotide 2'-phosphodiesterase (5'-nucleotidase family)
LRPVGRLSPSLELTEWLEQTDTHGWLAGHLKEQNYGADWGDFVTFSRRMKQMAGNRGVDMLLIDTGSCFWCVSWELAANILSLGDLHDGTGLTDAYTPDGEKALPIFDEIDYDLLTIGEFRDSNEVYQNIASYRARKPRALCF